MLDAGMQKQCEENQGKVKPHDIQPDRHEETKNNYNHYQVPNES